MMEFVKFEAGNPKGPKTTGLNSWSISPVIITSACSVARQYERANSHSKAKVLIVTAELAAVPSYYTSVDISKLVSHIILRRYIA